MLKDRLLDNHALDALGGLPRKSTRYALMKIGDFPRPVRIGRRGARWFLSDIEAYLDKLRAARNAA